MGHYARFAPAGLLILSSYRKAVTRFSFRRIYSVAVLSNKHKNI
jgi:hypothetical protein